MVNSACGCVVCSSGRVDVGREEELRSFHGIKVDIVQVKDLVELDAILVDWGEGSVAHLSKEGDALEALLSVGQGNVGEGSEVKVFGYDGRVAWLVC
jgi:hypothetical protein